MRTISAKVRSYLSNGTGKDGREMMKRNPIGWCDRTINPVVGCKNGCSYCYAKKINDRFHIVPDFSKPEFFPERLKQFNTRKPKIIFIDSMSDIEDWRKEWWDATMNAMAENKQHIYLALTKQYFQAHVTVEYLNTCNVPLYIGVTVTNEDNFVDLGVEIINQVVYNRRDFIDFISFEPLIEKIDLTDVEIKEGREPLGKWWIIGDLTKNGKPQGVIQKEWVQEMVEFCRNYNIPVFMKDSIRDLMGSEFVQEFPAEFTRKVGER